MADAVGGQSPSSQATADAVGGQPTPATTSLRPNLIHPQNLTHLSMLFRLKRSSPIVTLTMPFRINVLVHAALDESPTAN